MNFEGKIPKGGENCNILKIEYKIKRVFWEIINGEIGNFGILGIFGDF